PPPPPPTSQAPRGLQHADAFAVFDPYGDVVRIGKGEQGVFHEGTRFLSRTSLRMFGRRPLLLSSTVIETNDLLAVDLTNADIFRGGTDGNSEDLILPHGAIHVFRSKLVWEGVVYERIRAT